MAAQPPCVVAMEACGSSHHWGRAIGDLGHEVRLIPPAYVKPFVKRQKNDAADAEAICEAVQRPNMRFVAVKTEQQQASAMVFRTRDLLVRQRTQLVNALRGHLTEYGWVAPQGRGHVAMLGDVLEGDMGQSLPEPALAMFRVMLATLDHLDQQIEALDEEIKKRAREDEVARRLMTIPGIGPIAAIPAALQYAGLKQDDIDWFELNEAFAAQSLAVINTLGLDASKVNPMGGAIALGHPLGATGAIRAATVVHALKRHQKKYGMVTMCVGMGQGAAGIFERV
jgi:transposase